VGSADVRHLRTNDTMRKKHSLSRSTKPSSGLYIQDMAGSAWLRLRSAIVRGRSVSCEFQTVVTGAGISVDPPSNLPAAEALIEEVWHALRQSLSGDLSDSLASAIESRIKRLRMEQTLELLTGPSALPVRLVVQVYRLVGNALFNTNHLRLASLDVDHFTLNMDTLLEEAGPGAKVTHVHGVWNRPRSIRTTVTHYSRGLSWRLTRKFGKALRDKDVLVLGYSGRDLDVITLFERYPPKSITWVNRNPGSWEREVQVLRQRFDADPAREFLVEPKWAGEYLPDLVVDVPSPATTVKNAPATGLDEGLRRVPKESRLLAVGRLMFGLGLHQDLYELLNPRVFKGPVEIERRKLIARALSRDDRRREALVALSQRPNRLSEIWPWVLNINEIAALAQYSGRLDSRRLSRLIRIAAAIIPTHALRRMSLLTRVRASQRLSVGGAPLLAAANLKKIVDAPKAHWSLGESNYADALTWYADSLKSCGDLIAATDAASRAIRLVEYCLPSQAAYALWKYAEILAAGGPPPTGNACDHRALLMRNLAAAIKYATASNARITLGWLHGTVAELLAYTDTSAARRQINKAAAAGADSPERGGFARGYHLLQRAVVERAEGHLGAADRSAEMAVQLLKLANVPGAVIQGQQFLAEIRWKRNPTRDLPEELDLLAERYRGEGMALSEGRVLVTAAVLRGVPVTDRLLHLSELSGWHDLRRRAVDGEPAIDLHELFL